MAVWLLISAAGQRNLDVSPSFFCGFSVVIIHSLALIRRASSIRVSIMESRPLLMLSST